MKSCVILLSTGKCKLKYKAMPSLSKMWVNCISFTMGVIVNNYYSFGYLYLSVSIKAKHMHTIWIWKLYSKDYIQQNAYICSPNSCISTWIS